MGCVPIVCQIKTILYELRTYGATLGTGVASG